MSLVGGINGWVIGGILAVLAVFALACLIIGWVVAPLAGTTAGERAGDCACGHPAGAHEHHRGGSDCGLCASCGSFRRPPLIGCGRARAVPAPDDQEIDQAIANVAGAGGPSDAQIEQMVRDYYKKGGRP